MPGHRRGGPYSALSGAGEKSDVARGYGEPPYNVFGLEQIAVVCRRMAPAIELRRGRGVVPADVLDTDFASGALGAVAKAVVRQLAP